MDATMPNDSLTWQLQDAKNRLSALIDAVEDGHEQIITRHGVPVGVVVPYAIWQRWQAMRLGEAPSMYEALRVAAPLGGVPDLPPRSAVDTARIPDFG